MSAAVSRILELLERVPDDPFYTPRRPLWLPGALAVAPALDTRTPAGPVERRFALLLNPFYAKSPHGSFGKHVLTPSLALTAVAGATPPGWRLQYWDENLLQGPPPVTPVPEVVGITVHLTFARRAYELAAWYRGMGSKVILGGMHVHACEQEVAAHADAISVGDGTQTWGGILRDVERGALRPRYEAGFEREYDLDPPPRRDLLPRGSFLTTTSVIATRGCRNRCAFCYLSTGTLRMPYRMRDPEDVARQIEAAGQPYAVFLDNNLGGRRDYLRRLCGALRPIGTMWSAAVTLDVTDEPALVRDMALAGCAGVFVGFETLTDENLVQARKRTPRSDDYGRRVRIFHEHGIKVNGSFVVGFDGDRKDTFTSMAQWIEDQRLDCATFHILTPYPGTPLFRRLESEGRILHRNWDLYDTAHAVFRPAHLTPEELELGYDWLYRRLFSHASIWTRRPEHAREWPEYFGGAYLYKRSNRLWRFLIAHRLVQHVWHPLVASAAARQARRRGAGSPAGAFARARGGAAARDREGRALPVSGTVR